MSMRDIHLGLEGLPYHLGVKLPFESPADQDDSEDVLMRLLGIVCRVNLMYLHRHPGTSNLYSSGVVYTQPDQAVAPLVDSSQIKKLFELLREMGLEPETALMIFRIVRGIEVFLDIPSLYRRGRGDCNELVPVRVAELWRAGIAASPYLTKQVRSDGRPGISYHAVVHYLADNSIEDPSLILGMGGPDRADERREEIRKNVERWDNHLQAARHLIEAEGVPTEILGREIDLMGFVPRDGVFRA